MTYFVAREHRLRSRIFAGFCLIWVFVAFMLAIISTFAGTTKAFVPQAQLFQINAENMTTRASLPTTGSLNSEHLLELPTLSNTRDNIKVASDAVPAPAGRPAAPDFYNVYLWTYCVGFYDSTNTTMRHGAFTFHYGITWCSPRTLAYGYNTINTIQSALPAQIVVAGYSETGATANSIWIFYVIGVLMSGLAIIPAIGMVISRRLFLEVILCLFVLISFLFMLGASILTSALISISVRNWNSLGNSTGIAAYDGGLFLSLTWACTGMLLILEADLLIRWKARHNLVKEEAKTAAAEEAAAEAAAAAAAIPPPTNWYAAHPPAGVLPSWPYPPPTTR